MSRLASGNSDDEALFHAICELIERDATALWSLRNVSDRQATEFSLTELGDAILDGMAGDIADAGVELRLFDQTTDLGVPCVMDVISETCDWAILDAMFCTTGLVTYCAA